MKIVVIGGGISGLSTAFLLQQRALAQGRNMSLSVLEAAPQGGGTMQSTHDAGFLCERGPNGFLDSKPHTLELVEQLGLQDRLLRADESAARRFVWVDGAMIELPSSPGSFLMSSLLPFWGRMRVLWEPFIKTRKSDEPESVADFARRRLGRHAYERLVDPFVSGVFAGDPESLSVNAAFPRLVALEQKYGSLIRASTKLKKERRQGGVTAGPSGHLTSFPNGLSELVNALKMKLGTALRCDTRVQELRRTGDHWTVIVGEGEHISGVDQVVLAVPAYVAARILGALDASLGQMLGEIPYAPAAVVALGFQKKQISHPLNGFGFLVPGREARPILGSLWSSSIFPGHRAPEGCALIRTIVGGARNPKQATLEEDDLIRSVLGELTPLLGIDGPPIFSRIERYINAIPQYDIGHLARVANIETALGKHPGLRLSGNAFRGVGINDCTRESFALAECLLPEGG